MAGSFSIALGNRSSAVVPCTNPNGIPNIRIDYCSFRDEIPVDDLILLARVRQNYSISICQIRFLHIMVADLLEELGATSGILSKPLRYKGGLVDRLL